MIRAIVPISNVLGRQQHSARLPESMFGLPVDEAPLPIISQTLFVHKFARWSKRYFMCDNHYLLGYRFSFHARYNETHATSKFAPIVSVDLRNVANVYISSRDLVQVCVEIPPEDYFGCEKDEVTDDGLHVIYFRSNTAAAAASFLTSVKERVAYHNAHNENEVNASAGWLDASETAETGFFSAKSFNSAVSDKDSSTAAKGKQLFNACVTNDVCGRHGFEAEMEEQKRLSAFTDSEFETLPPTLWGNGDPRLLKLRGHNYMQDRVKFPAVDDALFKVFACDLVETNERGDCICDHPKNRMTLGKLRAEFPSRFIWVLNFQIPGPPYISFVLYMIVRDITTHIALFGSEEELASTPAAQTLLAKLPKEYRRMMQDYFVNPDNTFRDTRSKMVPRIIEGPWVVAKAVGTTPVLVGTKLKQRYFLKPNFMELDLDINKDPVAKKLTQLSVGYAKKLKVDLAYLIEGRDEDELPEITLCVARAINVDFRHQVKID